MSVGPQPNYHAYDVFRALRIIDTKGPIGRHLLRKKMELTECSVRTILKKLLRDGFIESTQHGQVITQRGKEYLDAQPYFCMASHVDAGRLSLGPYDFCIVARQKSASVSNGISQRDEAIKIGGDGATVLVYRNGTLTMPPGFMDIESDYPEDVSTLCETFRFNDGDVLIIGSGSTRRQAELAAMAAYDAL